MESTASADPRAAFRSPTACGMMNGTWTTQTRHEPGIPPRHEDPHPALPRRPAGRRGNLRRGREAGGLARARPQYAGGPRPVQGAGPPGAGRSTASTATAARRPRATSTSPTASRSIESGAIEGGGKESRLVALITPRRGAPHAPEGPEAPRRGDRRRSAAGSTSAPPTTGRSSIGKADRAEADRSTDEDRDFWSFRPLARRLARRR